MNNYRNNIWLLGGNIDDEKIYVRRSNNEGINLDNPIPIYFYPNHICSNFDFFELENHDIISLYWAIWNISSVNADIKYNRKICSSISNDGGKTFKNLCVVVANFELAIKLGKKSLSNGSLF